MDDIVQLRLLIEPPVVSDVTPLIPEEDFDRLRRLAQDIVVGAEQGNLQQYTDADTTFHLALLSYSNNARIVDLVSDLRRQTRLVGLADLAERGELAESAREHLRIVDVIQSRDSQAVERLLDAHIRQVRTTWASPRAQPEPETTAS
jgi:DNA-binding GntR family transcriptional regulator